MDEESNTHAIQQSSKREIFYFHNNLVCLVKALEGSYTLVDLRNESCIAGKIVKVDGFMNIEMEEVVYVDSRGQEHCFSNFFVRHRNIRYVHIPTQFRSVELMHSQLNGMNKFKEMDKKGKRTFKQIRAQRYQKEIVSSLKK